MSSLGTEKFYATTDATGQTYNLGTLAAVGASIKFIATLQGVQDNGRAALVAEWHGNATRSSVGNGFATALAIGPTGFVDAVLVPWTTILVPVGWAAVIAFAGNVLQVQWNGAAATNVNWHLNVSERFLLGGATL
jgi:hypothetical protein